MLYRKVTERLKEWLNHSPNALLVYGARQVGKTTIIREFGRSSFRAFDEINFAANPHALNLLLEAESFSDFQARLTLVLGHEPKEGDLVFFDEIQVYFSSRNVRIQNDPGFAESTVDILTLSKPIVEQGTYRLIMSGSLLGVTILGANLNPVGFVDELTMYPMDFEEFLLADGMPAELIRKVQDCFAGKEEVPEELNRTFLSKFRAFSIVGGMPEAVSRYVNGNDLKAVSLAHQSVLSWYKKDVIKYAPLDSRLIILEMLEILPSEVNAKNKKFIKSNLDVPNFKNLDLKDRFLWLSAAGIAIPVYNVDEVKAPLRSSLNYKVVKLFANDTGLLVDQLFEGEITEGLFVESNVYDFGAIYENAAAQLLLCHGFLPRFHVSKKGGELDFVVESGGTVLPIEIKSGSGDSHHVYEHKALDHYLSSNPSSRPGMVFGNTNVFCESSRIENYPIYMIDFLRKGSL